MIIRYWNPITRKKHAELVEELARRKFELGEIA
jgi:Na+/melibiose symporter-like transporter